MTGFPGRRWPTGRAGDVILAAGIVVIMVVSTVLSTTLQTGHAGLWPAGGWILVVGLPVLLIWRRDYPLLVLWITLAGNLLYYPLTEPDGPIIITLVVALFTAADEGRYVHALTATGLGLIGAVLGEVFSYPVRNVDDVSLFLITGGMLSAVAAGAAARNRRAYLNEAEQRVRDAEASKEETARARAAEERLRLAREIHDVVGHHLSLINVQSGAALHRLKKDPGQAEEALSAIKSASRDALREIRATLGVLRQADEEATTEPTPGLALLDTLLDRHRSAGLDVKSRVEGAQRALQADIDLAAYRILQESLTNIRRHTAASLAEITIRYGDNDLLLQIDDDGEGDPGPEGHGIRGMRERAQSAGGTLTAGPRPEGGFRVRAELPLESA